MIRITVYENQDKEVTGFDCQGHAGYADSGQDIVCAGVSAIVLNTINSVDSLTEDKFMVDSDEDSGMIHFRLEHKPSRETLILLQSMVLGLTGIRDNYSKKYITIKIREV